MSTTNGRTRERKLTEAEGVPMVDLSFARAESDRERVRLWWEWAGRLALMSLSAAALAGCGPGTSEARCRTTGAWMAQNESGPVIVIARACKPAGDE